MRECLICSTNLDDVPLNEGRCPQCGAVVEWSELIQPEAPKQPDAPKKRTEVKTDHIATIWKQSIVSDSDLSCTIKSQRAEITVSDSVYSIQHRELLESKDLQFGVSLDYELLEVIGEGGVGVVYSARQASIDRRVAIKMLRDEFRVKPEHRDKFLAEAVLTGELDHPNIVPIYDLGRNRDGELFYAMKNVIGTPWDRVIHTQPQEQNLEILHKVADAVAFAHSRGVIHRDLKPENIMLGEFGEVLVMDWGIAMPTEGFNKSSSILRSQAMGGTPAYMAPELASGPVERIGKASDVYLLGAILFEILSGKPPHHGTTVLECVRNAANNVIVETDRVGELMDIALKAMESIPGRRYRSVQDFQKAIRNYEYHRESLVLMENAKEEFEIAKSTGSYSAFNRVVFAFSESLKLWAENSEAQQGLFDAKIAYAEVAYRKEDFDLGLSILEGQELQTPELIAKLKRGQSDRSARQARLTAIRRIAVVLGIFIFITGSIGSTIILFLYSRSAQLNDKLLTAQDDLKELVVQANEAKERAETQTTLAVEQKKLAETQTKAAEAARLVADTARIETASEKKKADESSYFAEIGLIGASIQQNSFMIARNLLDGLNESEAKSKLRHWEWGRYQYLVNGGSQESAEPAVRSISLSEDIVKLSATRDGSVVAYGLLDGEFGLIDVATGNSILKGKHGDKIHTISMAPNGLFLATSGWDAEKGNSVLVWKIDNGSLSPNPIPLEETTAIHAIDFNTESNPSLLLTGGERKSVKVWDWQNNRVIKTFVGHLEGVTCVRFSPDQRWIASSSTDGTIRIWDNRADRDASSAEAQRFSSHSAAVAAVDFAPNGKWIASGDSSGQLLVWPLAPFEKDRNEVEAIQLALQGDSNEVKDYWRLQGHQASIHGLQFSLDGDGLLSCGSDNLVLRWKIPSQNSISNASVQPSVANDELGKTLTPQQSLRGHGGWVRSCGFAKGCLYSGGDDQTLRFWNPKLYQEQLVLSGGEIPATQARMSPDATKVVTSYVDGTMKVWSRQDGQLLGVLREGHEYLTNAAAFFDNKRRLVTAAGDNSLRLWDVEKGIETFVVAGTGRNAKFAISRDEKWLVATGDSTGIPIWSLERNSIQQRLALPMQRSPKGEEVFAEPACICISDRGQYIAVGGGDGMLAVWDLGRSGSPRIWRGHNDNVVACFFAPDVDGSDSAPRLFSVSTDGSVAQWSRLDTNSEAMSEVPGTRLQTYAPLQSAALSQDGRRIACSAPINKSLSRLWVYDVVSGQALQQKDLKDAVVQELYFDSRDINQLMLTYSTPQRSTKTIAKLAVQSGSLQTFPVTGVQSASLWGVLTDSDRERLITYGGRGARLWNTNINRLVANFRPNLSITEICFAPDGKSVVSGSADGTLQIWSLSEMKSLKQLERMHKSEISSIRISADASRLLTSSKEGLVVLWDLSTTSPIAQYQCSAGVVPNDSAWHVDQSSVWIATSNGQVLNLSSENLALQFEMEAHRESVECLAVSSDGEWLASGSADKSISIWSILEKKKLASLVGHSAAITAVEFSQDSLRLLSSSQDTSVRVWDTRSIAFTTTAKEVRTILGELIALSHHRSSASSAEFSRDGQWILTAGQDGDTVVWNSESIPPFLRAAQDQLRIPTVGKWCSLKPVMELSVPTPGKLSEYVLEVDCSTQVWCPMEIRILSVDDRYLANEEGWWSTSKDPSRKEPVRLAEFKWNGERNLLTIEPSVALKPSDLKRLVQSLEVQVKEISPSTMAANEAAFRMRRKTDNEIVAESRLSVELDAGLETTSPVVQMAR